jgi:hypothetical protein
MKLFLSVALVATLITVGLWAVDKRQPVYINSSGFFQEGNTSGDFLTGQGLSFSGQDSSYISGTSNGIHIVNNSVIQMAISSTGSVGINVDNPVEKLEVGGNISATALIFSDGTSMSTASVGGGGSVWTESGNDIYYIDGNVGVGTTAPTRRFHVADSAEITGSIYMPDSDSSSNGIIHLNGERFLHNYGSGDNNVFTGIGSGNLTSTGTFNVGLGWHAMDALAAGQENICIGADCLGSLNSGNYNVCVGSVCLFGTQGGSNNVVMGKNAMLDNVSGSDNVGLGYVALQNVLGSQNTGIGSNVGLTLESGTANVLIGYNADVFNSSQTNSVAIGANSVVSGSNNVVIGSAAAKFGIGLSSPSEKLSVAGSISASGFGYFLGNVGIGTYVPTSALEVAGDAEIDSILMPSTTTTDGIIYIGGTRFLHRFGAISNVFVGRNAGNLTNTGTFNGMFGEEAGLDLTSGSENNCTGADSCGNITSGNFNSCYGSVCMFFLQDGEDNTSMGKNSLLDNVSGDNNTAMGYFALENATGNENTGLGSNVGAGVITGTRNTLLGTLADVATSSVTKSVAIGYNAMVDGSNNMALGGTAGDAVNVGIGLTTPSERLSVNGNISSTGDVIIAFVGSGLQVKEGSNATMGTATLSSGTVTVNTTEVTASSRIFLTHQGGGANIGFVYISARSAATSFTITSSNASDSGSVAWIILEPAP